MGHAIIDDETQEKLVNFLTSTATLTNTEILDRLTQQVDFKIQDGLIDFLSQFRGKL